MRVQSASHRNTAVENDFWIALSARQGVISADATSQTIHFYNRHPISCDIILAKLRESRGHLNNLRPEELFSA